MKLLSKILGLLILTVSCNSGSKLPDSNNWLAIVKHYQLDSNSIQLYLRAFKKEMELELWAKDNTTKEFQKIQTYAFCTSSGHLGPKRREGDLQIPEGVYYINRFNPNSKFYLSLGLNYPNMSEMIRGDPDAPGSDIFIHGGCASVGCIAITDPKIYELYHLADWAQQHGQEKIPVHIFPTKNFKALYQTPSPHHDFWRELEPIFNYFERNKTIPKTTIDDQGRYSITSSD